MVEATANGLGDPLPVVRRAVRSLLLAAPAFRSLDVDSRARLARAMVQVCNAVAHLLKEELESDAGARRASPPAATALAAGDSFSGVAADRVAATTQRILNAVSFPRFVTDLINGVFKAMLDSSAQQMNSFVELLNNVAASAEGFGDANLGPDRARAWLAERYPGSYEVVNEPPDEGKGATTVRLRAGAAPPSPAALKTDLGLNDTEAAPPGDDPEASLVALARRKLAQTRQQMLATMVLLGMQRIVVESGRINASMRFHIDTRSAAQDDRGSTFDFRNQVNAGGSFGIGPWGASASISNTVGYVSTQRTQTTEEMNTDLDLNSSVEIQFRSDYLPLEMLAGAEQVGRIRANSRNPAAAEEPPRANDRAERARAAAASDKERREALDRALKPPQSPPPPAAGAPGSVEAAEQARKRGGPQQGVATPKVVSKK